MSKDQRAAALPFIHVADGSAPGGWARRPRGFGIPARHFAEDLPGWSDGPVAAEHVLRGFRGLTLFEQGFEHTRRLLAL